MNVTKHVASFCLCWRRTIENIDTYKKRVTKYTSIA